MPVDLDPPKSSPGFRRSVAIVALSLLVFTTVPLAHSGTDIQVRTDDEIGPHLVDFRGHTLYVFTEDEPHTSTCVGACAEQWPPLVFDGLVPSSSGVPVVQVGSITRADGSTQATFAGMPLYTFANDETEGTFEGTGLSGSWFPIGPDGTLVGHGADPNSADATADATPEEVMAQGRAAYTMYCAACHTDDGRGSVGPNLRENQRLANDVFMVRQLRDGGDEMPGFGGVMSDADLAAVATYVRNSWGNTLPPMTAEQFRR
jgi:predicted lipoprotein with Yx(FWY)xxD motif/mono/diheme cytochrome c family protein